MAKNTKRPVSYQPVSSQLKKYGTSGAPPCCVASLPGGGQVLRPCSPEHDRMFGFKGLMR
jgi:hypothetical protein